MSLLTTFGVTPRQLRCLEVPPSKVITLLIHSGSVGVKPYAVWGCLNAPHSLPWQIMPMYGSLHPFRSLIVSFSACRMGQRTSLTVLLTNAFVVPTGSTRRAKDGEVLSPSGRRMARRAFGPRLTPVR